MDLSKLPRLTLAPLPTPLHRAPNLERALGPDSPRIYLKRDDLTGLAFGGNKVRKLEYLLADAAAKQATVVLTEGAVQSNHARATAGAAAVAGLHAILVLDTRHGDALAGNYLLDQLLGAEVHLVPDPATRHARLAELAAAVDASGGIAYPVPTGGSVPLGAVGYVNAILELNAQLGALGERPATVTVASGSGGTLAGLVAGTALTGADYAVEGVAVQPVDAGTMAEVADLATQTAALLGADRSFQPGDITLRGEFGGPRYGEPTPAAIEAFGLLARTEAVFLDPVYTAKAMSGLLADIRAGRYLQGESVVFIHTGGSPALFAIDPGILLGTAAPE